MAYIWADVLPSQVADDVAINGLGNFVETLDTRATALENAVYRVSQKLAASQASIIFSGIPSTYRHLKVAYTARCDLAGVAQQIWLRINGDATGPYDTAYVELNSSATLAKTTFLAATQVVLGVIPGATATAGIFGSGLVDIPGWDSPHSGNLGVNMVGQFVQDASNMFVVNGGGRYRPAAPPATYTSVTLLPQGGNFVAGTEVTLEAR